jgi:hypothetical protein
VFDPGFRGEATPPEGGPQPIPVAEIRSLSVSVPERREQSPTGHEDQNERPDRP